jgi:hypothetical protein
MQLVWCGVMKCTALIALLVDTVEFCRRGLTTDVLLELRPLGQKIEAEKNGDTVLIRGSPVGRGDYDL